MQILDEDKDCEVAFLAYGDYCDGVRMIQDSANPDFLYAGQVPDESLPMPSLRYSYSGSEIERWLAQNRSTGGGDHPECIEYVLRYLRYTHAPFAQEREDQLIVFWIGDAPPHGFETPTSLNHDPYGYTARGNAHNLNWEQELDSLAPFGVTIYTALCGEDQQARHCWGQMSTRTGGISVDLNNINNLANTMIAVVKRETGQLDDFARDVREGGVDAEMEEILVDLGASCYD